MRKKIKGTDENFFFKITKLKIIVFILLGLILFSDKLFTTYCTKTFPFWCQFSSVIGFLYQIVSVLLIEKTIIYYIASLLVISLVIFSLSYLYKKLKLNNKNKFLNIILILLFIGSILFFRPINLDKYDFYDPTGEIELDVSFYTQGTNIFKDDIESNISMIMYGNYDTTIKDIVFEKNYIIKGNRFGINKVEYLLPDETQLTISEEEFEFIFNYFSDFQEYFSELPIQYHLYKKDHIVSLGDIILLQCENEAFERNNIPPVYFIPKENIYEDGYIEKRSKCYKSIILDNKQPTDLEILGMEYQAENLNSKKRHAKISFTFDVESGRYLNEYNKGEHSINQCDKEIYSLGLEEHEKICDNANILPEFSNYIGEIEGYPWVTGMKGFNEILDYSLKYGVPTTDYIVVRELKVFEQLDPTIIEKIEILIEKDLIEIGTHTYYHRHLGADILGDKEDLRKAKEYLEQRFNISVEGMRGPYFTYIGNNPEKHAEVLKEIGYTYFTNMGGFQDFGGIYNLGPNLILVSEESLDGIRNFILCNPYVLTIDHPWNMGYEEVEKEGEIYLKQNDERLVHFRKAILLSLNEGAIFVKAKELIDALKTNSE